MPIAKYYGMKKHSNCDGSKKTMAQMKQERSREGEGESREQLLAKNRNRTHPRSSLTQNHYVIKVAITADSKNRKLEHGTQTGWRRIPGEGVARAEWSSSRSDRNCFAW